MSRMEEIARLLNISLEIAEKVLDEMDMTGIDYSECEQSEFDETARNCYAYLTRYEVKGVSNG